MSRAAQERAARTEIVVTRVIAAAGVLLAAFLLYAGVVTFGSPRESRFDDSLPNPMGGPARTAPGEAVGEASLAGLRIAGSEVAMGDVALGVTYVPGWQVDNPTGEAVTITIGQPQVLEGCCPGPVYADGELTQADQSVTVPAGDSVLLQFPLQMHPGMDGPHHLTVPVSSGGEQTALHVEGNFTAEASA